MRELLGEEGGWRAESDIDHVRPFTPKRGPKCATHAARSRFCRRRITPRHTSVHARLPLSTSQNATRPRPQTVPSCNGKVHVAYQRVRSRRVGGEKAWRHARTGMVAGKFNVPGWRRRRPEPATGRQEMPGMRGTEIGRAIVPTSSAATPIPCAKTSCLLGRWCGYG